MADEEFTAEINDYIASFIRASKDGDDARIALKSEQCAVLITQLARVTRFDECKTTRQEAASNLLKVNPALDGIDADIAKRIRRDAIA